MGKEYTSTLWKKRRKEGREQRSNNTAPVRSKNKFTHEGEHALVGELYSNGKLLATRALDSDPCDSLLHREAVSCEHRKNNFFFNFY